jgi:hypothetical protein
MRLLSKNFSAPVFISGIAGFFVFGLLSAAESVFRLSKSRVSAATLADMMDAFT